MILLDSSFHELGEIETDIDCEIGTSIDSTNDFCLTNMAFKGMPTASGFYIPQTEIGGLFELVKQKSDVDYKEYRGYTWRGLMSKAIIEPPQGSDYKTVSGEANAIISSVLSNVLGGLYTVPNIDSGLNIASYQFPLYINVLDGLEGMLETYNYRLKISADKVASGNPIQVTVSAVPSVQVEGTYNEDNGIPLTYEVNAMGINHLVCAGQGELQNRMRVDLYINQNGEISQTQYYTGFEERTAFYDYGSAESEQDLIDSGTEELRNLASTKTLKMSAPSNLNLEIGDKVQGVFPDGTILISPIVQKIYQISNGLLSTEIKIKGEE